MTNAVRIGRHCLAVMYSQLPGFPRGVRHPALGEDSDSPKLNLVLISGACFFSTSFKTTACECFPTVEKWTFPVEILFNVPPKFTWQLKIYFPPRKVKTMKQRKPPVTPPMLSYIMTGIGR